MVRLAPLFLLLGGCYITKQALGQIDILLHREDVDKVAPRLPPDERGKLKLIGEIKEFGERRIGLKPTDNYTTYFDTKGKAITYVVTASRKDRFEPYTWWFPIVGTLPYKGFFSREDARAEARALEEEGWDVSAGGTGAYSTLGWFSDPVFSTMLEDSEEELANLILHELTHSTLYLSGRADFNESFASFVGMQGALEFIRWRYGERSEVYARAVNRFADEEMFDAFMQDLHKRLSELYAARLPDVLKRREEIFDRAREEFEKLPLRTDAFIYFPNLKLNNAIILGQRRYGRIDLYRRVFDAVGGDWGRFFAEIFRLAQRPDPLAAIEKYP